MMESIRRSVRFSFQVTLAARDAPMRVWVPCPIDDDWQRVLAESLPELPAERGRDPLTGNAMLHFAMPPGTTTLEVGFTVERRERAHAVPPPARYAGAPAADERLARYLRSDRRVRSDGANLERARAIASPDEPPIVIARKVFDHLLATFSYDARGCTPERSHSLGDLELACDLRAGTCTELHGLFVAFVRALGVPARFQFGYNVPRDKQQGRIGGYHCWAEIALPDGTWFPVDVSEAWKRRELADFYFGSLDPNRIAFTMGRDVGLVPPQSAPALDRFIFPYVEVDGAEIDPGLTFRFADV